MAVRVQYLLLMSIRQNTITKLSDYSLIARHNSLCKTQHQNQRELHFVKYSLSNNIHCRIFSNSDTNLKKHFSKTQRQNQVQKLRNTNISLDKNITKDVTFSRKHLVKCFYFFFFFIKIFGDWGGMVKCSKM